MTTKKKCACSGSKQKKCNCSGSSSPYLSGKELSERWQCARSSVDRIARRNGLKRLYLGEGKNGIVRFMRKEVEAYESSRLV